jgi:hypothetical protein
VDSFYFRASGSLDSLPLAKRISGLRRFAAEKEMQTMSSWPSHLAGHGCALYRVFNWVPVSVDPFGHTMTEARGGRSFNEWNGPDGLSELTQR